MSQKEEKCHNWRKHAAIGGNCALSGQPCFGDKYCKNWTRENGKIEYNQKW